MCSSAISESNEHTKTGSVGIPLVKNSIRIWNNEQNRECTYDEQGEVHASDPAVEEVSVIAAQNDQRTGSEPMSMA